MLPSKLLHFVTQNGIEYRFRITFLVIHTPDYRYKMNASSAAAAQIGISVESSDTISGLATSASTTTEATAVSSAQEFSQKVIESLFNYASSFALSADQARLR